MDKVEQLLTPEELAEYLRVPVSTVDNWRRIRRGPRVTRVGRHPRYATSDVRAWLEQGATRTEVQA